ncbi:MAG: site-specific integrase [Chitinophagaceae bacterium]
MSISIAKRKSRDNQRTLYSFQWGKAAGQRISTGIFTYDKPKDQIQKNHNKEALVLLSSKHSQMILDHQSVGSSYIPLHKLKVNFLDFYEEFIKSNKTSGNRHLKNSLSAFKVFINRGYISASEISEELCERFRNYLLSNFNGETPADYFYRFKRVIKAATKKGYFKLDPSEDIKSKSRKNFRIKDILTLEEYISLMQTPCFNHEIKKAFVVSLYTGLRWVDIKCLDWSMILESSIRLYQNKTEVYLEIPLHDIASDIMGKRKQGLVFHLPTQDGANKVLGQWCKDAGIIKHITWHCARHSFSVLLRSNGVDDATIAGMLGHTSTKYVNRTYKRYQIKIAEKAIQVLPGIYTESNKAE